MRLETLAAAVSAPSAAVLRPEQAAVEIQGLAYDSRVVGQGDLFFCVTGFRSDGHEFASQALQRGAAALVVERELGLGVPELLVASARGAMAPLAACFHGWPSRDLKMVAVTGTNGKTTTTYMVRALLEAGAIQCGLLGTVKSVIAGHEREVQRTTPEAIELQADLRAMLDGGDRACVMEVSSHALALGRSDAIEFAAAVFTNLTQDHLDFHPTMDDYFLAKRRLFVPPTGPRPGVSVVNIGDEYGRRLAGELQGMGDEGRVWTFALDQPADYSATEVSSSFDGATFTLRCPEGERRVALPMPGRFNVANALGALAAAHALGCELDGMLAALEAGVRVPGRFEAIKEGQDFAVLVDYAHTPDSLENVLAAAGELAVSENGRDGRVICVFGAGGDRDRGKRPLMGAVAARLADEVLVTSDNPRSEDPDAIIAEIMAGAAEVRRGRRAQPPQVHSLSDRRAAIAAAVAGGRRGDVLVIAGKGHEQGQEFENGRKVPFDDVTVAREALGALHVQAGAPRG